MSAMGETAGHGATTGRRQARHLRGALTLGMASGAIFAGASLSAFWLAYDALTARRDLVSLAAGLVLATGLAVAASRRRRLRAGLSGAGVLCGLGVVGVTVTGVTLGLADQGAAAASLSILIPMAACGLRPRRGRGRVVALTVLAMGIGVAALLVTREASAIGGLSVGALVAAWLAWRADRATPRRWIAPVDATLAVALLAAGAVYLVAMFVTNPPVIPDTAMNTHLVTRRWLWRDALTMIGDYPYTGSGLAGVAMVMSSYAWLRHVPYHPHAHNLFLQVGLEQGIPAVVGLLGMFSAGAWILWRAVRSRDPRVQPFAMAASAALVTLFCAGLFESDLAGSALLSCLFLPFGLTFGLGFGLLKRERRRAAAPGWRLPVLAGAAPMALILLIVAALPDARARWHANMGALLQTRAELGVYRWPEWSIQDQLRRDHAVDLEPAMRRYREALSLDPDNATARRRLGQIALSTGQTREAVGHLESASAAAPTDRAAQRLLAEAYALTGNREGAMRLWNTIGIDRDELGPRLWWYWHVGNARDARRFEDAVREFERLRARMSG